MHHYLLLVAERILRIGWIALLLHQNIFVLRVHTRNTISFALPELLDEVLSLLDDVDGDLQRGLLLLAEALDQILDGLHRLGINVVQQLLLELLQPCPQLEEGSDFLEVLFSLIAGKLV